MILVYHLIFIEVHMFENWKQSLIHFHIYINMKLLKGYLSFSQKILAINKEVAKLTLNI